VVLYPEATSVGGSLNPGAFDEIGRSRLIRNEGRHLEFGKGDIGIHMGDTSDVALLLFRNLDTPVPIGELLNRQRRRKVEIMDSDVVMSFSNTESIDALMKCLKVIRRSMRTPSARVGETGGCHE
jgi:hypothetical protein